MIGFSAKKQSSRYVKELQINIEENEGNFFVNQAEVTDLINTDHTDYILSQPKELLELKILEERLESHAFISDAQLYFDIEGRLQIDIKQAKPIARLLFSDGKGRYIDQNGTILPLNTRHTARVLIVEIENKIDWEESLLENSNGEKLLSLINYIDQNEFWKAQIAQLVLSRESEITMLPQVTKQEIRFGKVEDIEEKFNKLGIFYKRILPYKGWNEYAFVDLKFKNQIVCE